MTDPSSGTDRYVLLTEPRRVEPCKDEGCNRHAFQLMLGPLRPDIVVCVHGYRFTRGEVLG